MHPYAVAQKDDPEIPDSYGITIYFRNGHREEFNVASHFYAQKDKPERLEFITQDNKWNVILWDVISRIEFDKRFSKFQELAEKKIKEGKAEGEIE